MRKPETYNIVLIRSGATEWDVAGRVVGRVDLPLAPDSSGYLASMLEGLEGAELSTILHGPDQCLLATAEAVARVTGGRPRKVGDLHDVGMGLWEGLREKELEEKFPSAYRQWREHPMTVSVPEGEPLPEAVDRLVGAIGRAIDRLRNPDPGVGIVLRPMSFTLVRRWLAGNQGELVGSEHPFHDWHEVSRARLRNAREGAGVGT